MTRLPNPHNDAGSWHMVTKWPLMNSDGTTYAANPNAVAKYIELFGEKGV